MERMRSRNADSQESWKEGEERSESKSSWADGGDPRGPSPGSVTQYINKTAPSQEYQVFIDIQVVLVAD